MRSGRVGRKRRGGGEGGIRKEKEGKKNGRDKKSRRAERLEGRRRR